MPSMAPVATDQRYLRSSNSGHVPENTGTIGGKRASDVMTRTGYRNQGSRQIPPTRIPSGHANSYKTSRVQKLDKSNSVHKSSLRRAKNSTDALRQRSQQVHNSAGHAIIDGSSGGREGRQFTVGNVGNNGMIYLR